MRLPLYRFFVLLPAAAALVLAQSETATLRGTVTNAAGAPLAAVTVALTDTWTGLVVRQTQTGKDGVYEIPYLKPGQYRANINEDRFENCVIEGIDLAPGQVRRLDAALSPEQTRAPGAETEPIAESPGQSAPPAQPLNETVGASVDFRAKWNDTPLVDFHPSVFPLLITAPAVQGNPLQGVLPGMVISGVSNRNQQTFAVDGIAEDTTPPIPTSASLDTVEVTIANAGVEASRPVNFNMVTHRGGEALHGWGYYKRESSNWNAAPFFNTLNPRYRVSEAAGDLSGAIVPRWTYFSAGALYQKTPYQETLYANVPTALMRGGKLVQYLSADTAPGGVVTVVRDPRTGAPFPDNFIPATRISSVATKYLSFYAPPNLGDANTFFNNYGWLQPNITSPYVGNWPFIRVDQKVSGSNQIYVQWMQNQTGTLAPGTAGTAFDSTQSPRFRTWTVSDVQALSSNLVNHFALARTSTSIKQGETEAKITPTTGDNFVSALGLQGVNPRGYRVQGFPALSITGLSSLAMTFGGGNSKTVVQSDNVLTVEDSVTWSFGRHSFKAGAQYFHYNFDQSLIPQSVYGAFNFTGVFTGLGYADFLLGIPATSTRANVKADRLIHQRQAGVFLADSFRVSGRLTLNYGVRWDYYNAPVYDDGYMANWNPTNGKVVVAPGTLTSVSPYFSRNVTVVIGSVVPKAKMTNFRPRVGLAYQLTGNMVLRGGFGEYTEYEGSGAGGMLNPTNPWDLTETYTNTISHNLVALSFPSPFPTSPSSLMANQTVTALPSRIDQGVIRQYNATLERNTHGLGLSVSYIGSRGTGLNYQVNVDKPRASATAFSVSRMPYPQFAAAYETRTDGEWHYDSLVAAARRRVGPVFVDTAFTWANNVSNYANTQDPYNVTNRWTRDGADRRLYFVANAMYALPFGKGKRFLNSGGPVLNFVASGWTFEAIAVAASGQYYSPLFTGADPANASAGYVTALPDCVGNPNTGARTVNEWFNPKAFAVPSASAGRYGNCGMNILEGFPIHVGHASLTKRIPVTEQFNVVFAAQVSNVTNTPHFTVPNNNISTVGAGAFTATSELDPSSPEKQGFRQIALKLRLEF
jgi:hypothetical protein